ncbi:TonB-dependent receptor [Novosphingobium sp.]|uniref:TonB-dependent receptor n=1 Tax=Novosphingobium sp. TaxID=1874826 RepID=UPI002FE1EC98
MKVRSFYGRPPRLSITSLALVAAALPAPAWAEPFRIGPGSLDKVIAQLGQQAGVTIVLLDPKLAARRSAGIRGNVPLRVALERVLRGTGAEAKFIAPTIVQIRQIPVRERRAPLAPARPLPVLSPSAPHQTSPGQDIVVTASKQGLTIENYPGSAKVIRTDEAWLSSQASEGSGAITRLSPALGATNLGRGRNKLFVRGVADSSFSGPTQATTGQYLGDVRLTYNAPDPDLNLYDMEGIEVLVGPQGTLYGPSALGGILRLQPNAPSSDGFAVTASTGLGFTRHGNASLDGAMMANIPIDANKAVRLVAFGGRAGGYIDAPAQGRRNINKTVNYGQRLTLRLEQVGAWTIDIGNVLQNFKSGDGQYVLRGDPPFTRSGVVPQPYENNYRLGFVTATRPLGAMEMTSVTSVARQDLSTVFDATGYDGTSAPARLLEKQAVTLFSQEMRLSGGGRSAPWVAGFALARSINRRTLSIGSLMDWNDSAGLEDDQLETAIFAQASRPLLPRLSLTAGLRLTASHSTRRTFDADVDGLDGMTGNTRRLSGTLGLVWRPTAQTSAFVDFRQGYRPGGLGFTVAGDAVLTKQFRPDDLKMIEWGVRWGDRERGPVALQATVFLVDWRSIQADIVGPYAIPYTANIGRGIIHGLDTEIDIRPFASFTLSASGFFNRSRLRDTNDQAYGDMVVRDTEVGADYSLPNVPRRGARFSATWEPAASASLGLTFEAAIRYVGPSRLGVGAYLDIPQGDYLVADLSAGLTRGKFGIRLDLANITDSHGNTFSYGNPFGVGERNQMTPLRPRSARISLHMGF